jgi:hypothetical protein
MAKIITLTKTQTETNEGKELLDLIIKVTSDGLVTDKEIRTLYYWVNRESKKNLEINAIDTLKEILKEALADNQIDKDERQEIHHILLRILPKEYRESAKKEKQDAARESWKLDARKESASEKQRNYIKALGGRASNKLNKSQASEMIDALLEGQEERGGSNITPRQMMILRFWKKTHLAKKGKQAISEWMDDWYDNDPTRHEAWELYKSENGHIANSRDWDSVELVPLGIGKDYLLQIKDPDKWIESLVEDNEDKEEKLKSKPKKPVQAKKTITPPKPKRNQNRKSNPKTENFFAPLFKRKWKDRSGLEKAFHISMLVLAILATIGTEQANVFSFIPLLLLQLICIYIFWGLPIYLVYRFIKWINKK